jgi:hypothetical protein
MSNYLVNVIIGCNVLASKPIGLLRKRVQYIFNCCSKSGNLFLSNDVVKECNSNIICNHIICNDIVNDDAIIELNDVIIEIFNYCDLHHNIMFYSESISKTRIMICKVLMTVFNVKLSELDDIFKMRYDHSIKTKDLDQTYYLKLNDDEINILKTYETSNIGIYNIQDDHSSTINDNIVMKLYADDIRSIEENNLIHTNVPHNRNRHIDIINVQSNISRDHDYKYIMNVMNGSVNSDLICEMLDIGMSITDILNSLTL